MTDGAKRVRKHREKMKAAGLKPVTIWVPDVNAPGYQEEIAQRECKLCKTSAGATNPPRRAFGLDIEGWK